MTTHDCCRNVEKYESTLYDAFNYSRLANVLWRSQHFNQLLLLTAIVSLNAY